MRRIVPLIIFIVAAVALVAPLGAQQKIKVSTESVPVYVTVIDSSKRLVPDLTQEDFDVLDNGKPQTVNVFENKPRQSPSRSCSIRAGA